MNTMWILPVATHRHSACPAAGTGSSHLQLPPVQIHTHTQRSPSRPQLSRTPWVTSTSSFPMHRSHADPAQTYGHFHTRLPGHLPFQPTSPSQYLLLITHQHKCTDWLQLLVPWIPGCL